MHSVSTFQILCTLLVLPSHELENGQQGNQDVKTHGTVAVEAMLKQTKSRIKRTICDEWHEEGD